MGNASFEGATILVTGGTGSIGRILVRRLHESGAREIRVVARNRPAPDERDGLPGIHLVPADVADPTSVTSLLRGVDVVFHLAALKDVARCEDDPVAALRTNVTGSINVVGAAQREPSVRRLVAVSSDKACAPIGVLGMTKALMERIVARAADGGVHAFGSVRLGNVWGASGSVLPRWRESTTRDGRIDVTDPDMTRFLLEPNEAVRLLLDVASRSLAGEIIAPRMRAYRLGDLADAFQKIHDVAVRVVGKRPGEKLHEDLVSSDEASRARRDGDLYLIEGSNAGPGVASFTSAEAERVALDELLELARA